MWGAWARYCLHVNPGRFARYAKKIWGISAGKEEAEAAQEGIVKTEAYFKSIGLPTCFTELGVGIQSKEVLEELADSCVFQGKRLVGSFKPLDKKDVFEVYKLANK
jgi:alcohol dehydrogenase YqhD (iron-dependent ADH family)